MADKTYKMLVTLSNGSTIDAGTFVAPQGPKGDTGTVPEALPQEASALKNGNLPTSGWTSVDAPIWTGSQGNTAYNDSRPVFNLGVTWESVSAMPLNGWTFSWHTSTDTGYIRKETGSWKKTNSYIYKSIDYEHFMLLIYPNGDVCFKSQNSSYGANQIILVEITQVAFSKQAFTISDTSITTNSDVIMELTDDGGVKSYSMEAGKITVIRDEVPTQPIPYTYKVKQTNASGQFTLVNHFVPSMPESPTSLPVTYKKASGSLPTSGWSTLDEGWKENTLPASRNWKSVTYGDGKYVAVASGTSAGAYSTDGVSWTEMVLPASRSWSSIAYGNGKFVAIALNSDKGAYSADGITWTETDLSAPRSWNSVTYGDGKFVMLVTNAAVGAYSINGINWTEFALPASRSWSSVTYGNDKFVAVAGSSGDKGAYSTDGITWTEMTMPGGWWSSVTYGDGKFVAVADSSNGAYSSDGISWTSMTMPASRTWQGVTYGNGKFVAVSNTTYGAYSTDGINWTDFTLPTSHDWRSVTYGNGKFVAIAWNSTDGAYWKATADITYTISDTFITANTSVKMYLTDEGDVKAQSKASGSITVIRDTVPTTAIPYEYEVEQTSAEGLFEVINAYVPTKTSQLTNDSGFITAADIPSAGEWVDVAGETATLTQAGTYQVIASVNDMQSIVYWDGSTMAYGTKSTAPSVSTSGGTAYLFINCAYPQIDASGTLSVHLLTAGNSSGAWTETDTVQSGFKYRKIN